MRPADETRVWQLSEETLPVGKYLLKVYIDSEQHLERQPTAMLTNRSFYGQTIIEGEWTKTFQQARKITGSQLKREWSGFDVGVVEEQVDFDRILIRYGVADGQSYNLQPPK